MDIKSETEYNRPVLKRKLSNRFNPNYIRFTVLFL